MENKLYRDEQNKTIGGVCAGLSDYFNVDVSWVRVAFLVALTFGFGFMAYIILWIVVPAKNPFLSKPFVDYTVPPMSAPFAPAKRKPSNAAIVFGSILVVMGTLFLLCQFDLIPDWDYGRLWPVVFIAIGVMLIFSSTKNKVAWANNNAAPWDKDEPAAEENNDNPTTL